MEMLRLHLEKPVEMSEKVELANTQIGRLHLQNSEETAASNLLSCPSTYVVSVNYSESMV